MARVRAALFCHHLDPGEPDSDEEQVFIGLCFGRQSCRLAVRYERLWRLRLAIKEVLRRRRLSGDALRCLLGHATWTGMVRRECLSIFSAVYAFVEKAGARVLPLWGAVARELRWLSSILPLMFADLQRPWCRWLYVTDAEGPSLESHGGFGVVRRPVSAEICRDLGQVSEQWRYDSEDFVEARSQALSEAQERLYQDLVLGIPILGIGETPDQGSPSGARPRS